MACSAAYKIPTPQACVQGERAFTRSEERAGLAHVSYMFDPEGGQN